MELAEEILQDKIELAALHFKSKNFTKCLSLYNEIRATMDSFSTENLVKIRKHYNLSANPVVGRLVHPKLSSVLDARAATFEKLEQFDLAFKDAEAILKMDPLNCKGYLRCGKLLLKQEKLVDAYKCYQRGVYYIEKAVEKHKVSISEKLFAQLKAQYKKVNGHLKEQMKGQSKKSLKHSLTPTSEVVKAKSFSSNSLQRKLDDMLPLKRSKSLDDHKASKKRKSTQDPVYRLPHDVIELIFSLLPTRSLLRCHHVSKDWYQTLTSMPRLYKNIFALKHRVTAPEYFQGVRLMKKILMYLFTKSVGSVKIWSTLNAMHLGRILENIITDKTLNLSRLEIMSPDLCYELLVKTLDKAKWDISALQSVEHVRFGFNSSISNPQVFLKLFPQLLSLDLLIFHNTLRALNKHILPLDMSKSDAFIAEAKANNNPNMLESLLFVNHTGLTKEFQKVRPGRSTYTVVPGFLDILFTNLKKLTVVNFDFTNLEVQLGNTLARNSNVKEIYLENNEGLSLKQFLTVVRLYEPAFKLEKLTVREKPADQSYSMVELDIEGLNSLHDLKHLDVYGSSLSCRGLLKLLSVANQGSRLRSLNIGKSNFIYFRKDKFITGHDVLEFEQIFRLAPGLQSLELNELDLDNLSMRLLHTDLVKITGYADCPLKKIDLSFCHQVNGVGLMNLVNASYSHQDGTSSLQFEELILHGIDINKETISLLTKWQRVLNIKNDISLPKWRRYGVNSLVLEVSPDR